MGIPVAGARDDEAARPLGRGRGKAVGIRGRHDRVRPARDEQQRDVLEESHGADPCGDLEAVHALGHGVEQDQ